jgi:hypothetical protein
LGQSEGAREKVGGKCGKMVVWGGGCVAEWCTWQAKQIDALDENKWSRKDCLEDKEELDWEMQAYRGEVNEVVPAERTTKMRQRQERVNAEVHHATQVVDRVLLAHNCRAGQTGGAVAIRNS